MESPWLTARYPAVVSLVTTVDPEGRPNASPKIWFMPTSYDPPLVMLSLKPGSDTRANIDETGLFVLHLPGNLDNDYVEKVLHTAKPLPRGENELDDVGLKWDWLEHDRLERPMPYLPYLPWFVCWALHRMTTGDHELYLAQVGLAGGFDPAEYHEEHVEGGSPSSPFPDDFAWYSGGIEDVLLHRGRNVFIQTETDSQFSVPPYR